MPRNVTPNTPNTTASTSAGTSPSGGSFPFSPFKFFASQLQAVQQRDERPTSKSICPLNCVITEEGFYAIVISAVLTDEKSTMTTYVDRDILDALPSLNKIFAAPKSEVVVGVQFRSPEARLQFIKANPRVSAGLTPNLSNITIASMQQQR